MWNSRFAGMVYSLFLFSARVAMIVQPGERNAFDQRWIEYTLLER